MFLQPLSCLCPQSSCPSWLVGSSGGITVPKEKTLQMHLPCFRAETINPMGLPFIIGFLSSLYSVPSTAKVCNILFIWHTNQV